MLKKIWSDPVWSKVISSVLAALLLAIGGYLAGLGPSFVSLVVTVWGLLLAPVSIPAWLLLIVGAATILVIGLVCYGLWGAFRASAPAWRSYVEDHLFASIEV